MAHGQGNAMRPIRLYALSAEQLRELDEPTIGLMMSGWGRGRR